ncbi:TetR/AcrR family transcriptional regulator [Duganella hordei]|uniref:TetR/AcrR family transcriptional regulator n=1 Tax=Duganella hordei TaxID=2865934 RepID=UPI00159D0BAB
MRKSKVEAAESRKRIVATAKGIFLREGIAATAISDLMVAAGLTQGGFYRHFESKEHLVAEANALAFADTLASFEAAVAGKSPRDAVDAIVHRYLQQLQGTELDDLCPLSNLSSELRHADGQLKAVVFEGYSHFVKFIAAYLMRLDYQDYVGLAESIVSVLVGAVSLAGVMSGQAASEAILVNARDTVKLLLQNAATSSTLARGA